MKIRIDTLIAVAALALALTMPLLARAAGDDRPAAGSAAAAADMTAGEVRKVDKESGKLTLKHGEIKNLDMPAMTMVFVVKNKAVLDKLQPGDKVKFKAINDGGKYTVTEIEALK